VPKDFSREEAQIYQDVLQLEVSYRRQLRGEWQRFLGEATRRGFTFQQAAKFWQEKKRAREEKEEA
jgi:hypothetical protein